LKGDTLQRAQAAALGMTAGFLVADDARALLDLGPLPNGMGKQIFGPTNGELLLQLLQMLQQSEQEPAEEPVQPQIGAPAGSKLPVPSNGNGKGNGRAQRARAIAAIRQMVGSR
jgi:hypothetical protein